MPSCSIFFPCDENKNMSSHPDHDLYGHCISSSESAKHTNDHAHSCPRMAKFSGFLRVCGGSPNPARLERKLLLATEAKSNSWNSLGWIKKMFQSMLETFAGSSQFPQFTKLEIAGRRHFIVWWIGLPYKVEPQLWPDQFICGHQFHALKLRPNPRSKT